MMAPSVPATSTAPRIFAAPFWVVAAMLAVLPVAIIDYSAFRLTAQSLRRIIETENRDVAILTSETLLANLKGNGMMVRTVASGPAFVDWVQRHDTEGVRDRLRRLLAQNPFIDRASVLDPAGTLWSDWPIAPESLGKSFAQRDYFRGTMATGDAYVSEVFQRLEEPRPLVVAISCPIRDEQKHMLGILVLQLRLTAVTGWVSRFGGNAASDAVVLDQHGIVAGHPRLDLTTIKNDQYAKLPIVTDGLAGKSQTTEYVDPISQHSVIATIRPLEVLPGAHWIVIAQQDRDMAYAPVARLRGQILLAGAIVAVLAMAAALGLARVQERNRRMTVELSARNTQLHAAIEAQNQANEALKNAQGELIGQAKLAGLGGMVASVAHEINNPLAFVSGNVYVLRQDLQPVRQLLTLYRQTDPLLEQHQRELYASIRDLAERIDLDYVMGNLDGILNRSDEGLKRIAGIVQGLRTYARFDDGIQREETAINDGIASTLTIAGGQARGKKVQLEFIPGDLPPLVCNLATLNQVVMNLVSNAIDACAERGSVKVRSWCDQSQVYIEVADTGCGIEPAVRAHLFEQNFTTKPKGKGMGFGLWISWNFIVKGHGGAIDVDSTPGQGSRFTIRLPRKGRPS